MSSSLPSNEQLDALRAIARDSGANFEWKVGAQFQDFNGVTNVTPVGVKYERDEEDEDAGPPEMVEETILQVLGGEYDDQRIAHFVATFDPPTVLDLIERAWLRDDTLYEEVGKLDGEPIYRRVKFDAT